MINSNTLPRTTQPTELRSVLPTDREILIALNAQVAFLITAMVSTLGHLDNKSHCKAVREIEFALNSVGKMPASRAKRRKG